MDGAERPAAMPRFAGLLLGQRLHSNAVTAIYALIMHADRHGVGLPCGQVQDIALGLLLFRKRLWMPMSSDAGRLDPVEDVIIGCLRHCTSHDATLSCEQLLG